MLKSLTMITLGNGGMWSSLAAAQSAFHDESIARVNHIMPSEWNAVVECSERLAFHNMAEHCKGTPFEMILAAKCDRKYLFVARLNILLYLGSSIGKMMTCAMEGDKPVPAMYVSEYKAPHCPPIT
eukprot:2942542-Pyramimonas_sp.AAC.1